MISFSKVPSNSFQDRYKINPRVDNVIVMFFKFVLLSKCQGLLIFFPAIQAFHNSAKSLQCIGHCTQLVLLCPNLSTHCAFGKDGQVLLFVVSQRNANSWRRPVVKCLFCLKYNKIWKQKLVSPPLCIIALPFLYVI
jgi:hypothetical protein